MDIPDAKVSGIAVRYESLNWSKKSVMVLSMLTYSNNCWIFCTGFPCYFDMVARAADEEPTITSPTRKCLFCSTYNAWFALSSARIVDTAPEV